MPSSLLRAGVPAHTGDKHRNRAINKIDKRDMVEQFVKISGSERYLELIVKIISFDLALNIKQLI